MHNVVILTKSVFHKNQNQHYYSVFYYIDYYIQVNELMLLQLITVKNVQFATIGILIVSLNFKNLFVMMLFLILAILLLSVLKVLIILVLFIALGNLMQLVYQEMQCLTIMDIYEMHFKEISVKDRVQNFNLTT